MDQLLAKLQDKTPFKAVAMSTWNTSLSPLASYAMPNSWFDELGAFDAGSVNTGHQWLCEYAGAVAVYGSVRDGVRASLYGVAIKIGVFRFLAMIYNYPLNHQALI